MPPPRVTSVTLSLSLLLVLIVLCLFAPMLVALKLNLVFAIWSEHCEAVPTRSTSTSERGKEVVARAQASERSKEVVARAQASERGKEVVARAQASERGKEVVARAQASERGKEVVSRPLLLSGHIFGIESGIEIRAPVSKGLNGWRPGVARVGRHHTRTPEIVQRGPLFPAQ